MFLCQASRNVRVGLIFIMLSSPTISEVATLKSSQPDSFANLIVAPCIAYQPTLFSNDEKDSGTGKFRQSWTWLRCFRSCCPVRTVRFSVPKMAPFNCEIVCEGEGAESLSCTVDENLITKLALQKLSEAQDIRYDWQILELAPDGAICDNSMQGAIQRRDSSSDTQPPSAVKVSETNPS